MFKKYKRNKQKRNVILVLLAAIFSVGVVAKNISDKELIDLRKNKNVQIIDLRTAMEVKQTGIIKGAIVKNYFDHDFDSFINKLDKSKQYIIYCRSGGRSGKANSKMIKAGLNVLNYNAGMQGWLSKKYQTIKK